MLLSSQSGGVSGSDSSTWAAVQSPKYPSSSGTSCRAGVQTRGHARVLKGECSDRHDWAGDCCPQHTCDLQLQTTTKRQRLHTTQMRQAENAIQLTGIATAACPSNFWPTSCKYVVGNSACPASAISTPRVALHDSTSTPQQDCTRAIAAVDVLQEQRALFDSLLVDTLTGLQHSERPTSDCRTAADVTEVT